MEDWRCRVESAVKKAYRMREMLRVECREGLLLRRHIPRVDIRRQKGMRETQFWSIAIVFVDFQHF